MPRLSQADLDNLNKNFEERTPQELIQWAKVTFEDRLTSLSAMQEAGNVVCHMISQLKLDIPVLFVDTGVMFQETLETRDRLASEYGLEVRTLSPKLTMQEQTEKFGVLYLSAEGQEQCCHMRKVEPLRAVAGEYHAIISSLRRADGGKRSNNPILSIDVEMNALRINPLANFNDDQLHNYIQEHSVITNPLHKQGYATIGCNRCTTPVMPGEPKRAGRWRHLGPWSVYCGINPTDRGDAGHNHIDLPQDVINRILGIENDFMI
ncbi:MAG: phosphoadenylyl-sulfate reductase [Rubinisphaera brasiliensis]|uniref:phosphoadenylyl-sulfate reductase n=1 Tax=Rubinisphaera brasiliensis TaxID=119 RepID=UPI00391CC4AA